VRVSAPCVGLSSREATSRDKLGTSNRRGTRSDGSSSGMACLAIVWARVVVLACRVQESLSEQQRTCALLPRGSVHGH
jgi:hypothetical protein